MLRKTVTASIPNNYSLSNYSIECVCGKVYPLKEIHETKTCSCGRLLQLSAANKAQLIKSGFAHPVN
jgi:hypothetical protein